MMAYPDEWNDVLKVRDQLKAENERLQQRLQEFEDFARDFIELEYDNILRERLEKILYKDGE